MLPELKLSTISTQSDQPAINEKSIKKCFHGFEVGISDIQKYTFTEKLYNCDTRQTIIHKAQCPLPSKCTVAVKTYLPKLGVRPGMEMEREAYSLLKALPHNNFIEFFGEVNDDQSLYLVLEFQEKTFSTIVDSFGASFNVKQFHEMLFQFVSMILHLDNLGLIHNDFNTRNMLFDRKNGLVKLFDFDSSYKGNDLLDLPELSQEACHVQTIMKYKKKDSGWCSCFKSAYFQKTLEKEFTTDMAYAIIRNDAVWHDEMPHPTREILSFFFVTQKGFDKKEFLIRKLEEINPREALILPF